MNRFSRIASLFAVVAAFAAVPTAAQALDNNTTPKLATQAGELSRTMRMLMALGSRVDEPRPRTVRRLPP